MSFTPETVATEKDEKVRVFDRRGWVYGNPEQIDRFISRIALGDEILESVLKKTLQEQGGKAFGLKICEILSQKDTSGRLVVPKWEEFDPVKIEHYKEWNDSVPSVVDSSGVRNGSGLIWRSSAKEEDWTDSRAGVYPTSSFTPNLITLIDSDFKQGVTADWPLTFRDSPKEKLADVPYVVQEKKGGFGVVIDIGYSELLRKVVARVASGIGGKNGENATSATEDLSSSVGVWAAESGRLELPKLSFPLALEEVWSDSLLSGSFDCGDMVKVVYNSLQNAGINFGVQLELRVNPKEPDKLWLVQIRPAPESLRGEIKIDSVDQKSFELVSTSAKVSGAFDYMGNIVPADVDLLDYLNLRRLIKDGRQDIVDLLRKDSFTNKRKDRLVSLLKSLQEGHNVDLHGACLLLPASIVTKYKRLKDSSYGRGKFFSMAKVLGETLFPKNLKEDDTTTDIEQLYLQAVIEGVEVVITSEPIISNVSHGNVYEASISVQDGEVLKRVNAICLRSDDNVVLTRKITSKQQSQKARVVSDGLIGRIFLEK